MLTNENLIEIFVKEQCADFNDLKSETIADFTKYVELFAIQLTQPLIEATSLDIKLYIKNMRKPDGSPYAVATKNKHLSAIKKFYNTIYSSGNTEVMSMCMKRDEFGNTFKKENPANALKNITLKDKGNKSSIDGLSRSDLNKFIDTIVKLKNDSMTEVQIFNRSLDLAVALTLLNSGVRVSELINLKLRDVSKENSWLYISDSKNGESRYVSGINEKTFDAIDEYLCMREKYIKDIVTDDSYLFINGSKRPLTRQALNSKWKTYAIKAGVDETKIHNHIFRHTCGTMLYDDTKDINLVKEHLGHKSLVVSQRYVSSSDLVEQRNIDVKKSSSTWLN